MDGMLSQDEINALLQGMDLSDTADGGDAAADPAPENSTAENYNNENEAAENAAPVVSDGEELTDVEKDAIGEVANISMGSSATTLYSLVNRKVNITTPVVTLATWKNLLDAYEKPCVFIQIKYTQGLDGTNILVLKEHDVKVITDLMMGGDGTNTDGELGELHLSAISEAMNQMMGSAATSLSSMLNKTIDISPPVADLVDLHDNIDEGSIADFLSGSFVKISFKMEIGDLVDSEIMQLYPVSFAKEMCASITKNMEADTNSTSNEAEKAVSAQPAAPQPQMEQPMGGQQVMGQPMMGQPMVGQMPRPQAPQMQNGNLMGQLGGARPIPHFVRKSTGEIINITKPEFIIGKSKTKADYAIENNSAISREHCIVIQRDGVNYIKDNNSTNHTYVNGVELQPGKEVLLKHKTEVRLGDEEFTFLLRKGE